MHDGVDLVEGLYSSLAEAGRAVQDMARLGREKAEAERKYRVAKAKRMLYERDQNRTPVSIIGDIVKGQEDIAYLAFERDCAECVYEANREAVLLAKKRADIYREQVAREWSQAGCR